MWNRDRHFNNFGVIYLYDGLGYHGDTEPNNNNIVGLRLRKKSGTVIVKEVTLQSTKPEELMVHVFTFDQESNTIPIDTIELNTEINIEIPDSVDYYFGYSQSNLKGQAINKKVNWQGVPCGSCNRTWLQYYETWSPRLQVRAFRTETLNEVIPLIFDVNFGLNMALDVRD